LEAYPLGSSHGLGNELGGPGGAVGLHRPVVDGAADSGGDGVGVAGGVVHPPAGPVAIQAVGDVEVLLEVVAQREVQEPAAGSPSAPCRSSIRLHDREVADGQVPVELRDERADLQPLVPRQAAGSILGPVTTTMRSAGTRRLAFGNAR
jgi:hypothetical protein